MIKLTTEIYELMPAGFLIKLLTASATPLGIPERLLGIAVGRVISLTAVGVAVWKISMRFCMSSPQKTYPTEP